MITVLDTISTLIFTALLPPFFGVVVLVVTLASLGKTLGLRQKYVEILLKIFEFGKHRLAKNRKYLVSTSELTDEEEVDNSKHQNHDSIFEKNRESKLETHEFHLSDCLQYIVKGVEAIVDDEVTKRFTAEELTSWNFLTRTNCDYEFISVRLTVFWVVGFIIRYFFLFPLRLCILFIGVGFLVSFTFITAILPDGDFKKWLGYHAYLTAFRIVARSISAVIYFHNLDNRPKSDGICVANHTSPIDCVILSCDNVYGFVGQRHGGFLGIFQRALSRASDHIWFERGEVKDRFAVARRLRDHVEDPDKMPILIFPEGTCINNTSVMQFKKGTFEVGGIIYPVAIKYDARFGDAFWNSSKFSMVLYLYMMMTSWAIVCDVWYLPPMTKRENETSIDFANRVKAEIAKQGGLVDLLWDGALKRSAPKKELKEQFQHQFSLRLKLHDIHECEKKKTEGNLQHPNELDKIRKRKVSEPDFRKIAGSDSKNDLSEIRKRKLSSRTEPNFQTAEETVSNGNIELDGTTQRKVSSRNESDAQRIEEMGSSKDGTQNNFNEARMRKVSSRSNTRMTEESYSINSSIQSCGKIMEISSNNENTEYNYRNGLEDKIKSTSPTNDKINAICNNDRTEISGKTDIQECSNDIKFLHKLGMEGHSNDRATNNNDAGHSSNTFEDYRNDITTSEILHSKDTFSSHDLTGNSYTVTSNSGTTSNSKTIEDFPNDITPTSVKSNCKDTSSNNYSHSESCESSNSSSKVQNSCKVEQHNNNNNNNNSLELSSKEYNHLLKEPGGSLGKEH